MLGNNLLLPRFGFEIYFRAQVFVFVVLLCSRVFSVVLPMFFFHICWGFHSLAKIIFFLGLVFEIHFRERTSVFVVLLRSCVFQCFCLCFYIFVGLFIPENAGKIFLLLRFGFWNPFSGAKFCFLLSCCALVFFGGILRMCCMFVGSFCSRKFCWMIPLEVSESLAHSEAPTPHCTLFSSLVVCLVVCLVICLSVGVGSTAGASQRPLERSVSQSVSHGKAPGCLLAASPGQQLFGAVVQGNVAAYMLFVLCFACALVCLQRGAPTSVLEL